MICLRSYKSIGNKTWSHKPFFCLCVPLLCPLQNHLSYPLHLRRKVLLRIGVRLVFQNFHGLRCRRVHGQRGLSPLPLSGGQLLVKAFALTPDSLGVNE